MHVMHQRPRSPGNDVDSDTTTSTLEEDVLDFRFKSHSLRISASNVGAIGGFHPYKNLPQMLMDLCYQSSLGQKLLQHDANLLGLSIKSDEETMKELAKKAGAVTVEAVKKALTSQVGTTHDASHVKENVLKQAAKSGNLNRQEMKQLVEITRQSVDTGFGNVHEAEALDLYEKKCGWEVRERNSVIKEWPFRRCQYPSGDTMHSDQNSNIILESAEPICEAYEKRFLEKFRVAGEDNGGTKRKRKEGHTANYCTDDDDLRAAQTNKILNNSRDTSIENGQRLPLHQNEVEGEFSGAVAVCGSTSSTDAEDTSSSCNTASNSFEKDGSKKSPLLLQNDEKIKEAPEEPPLFYIAGIADGIRDELWYDESSSSLCPRSINGVDDDDDKRWKMRSIVVELKHRMRFAKLPPPFYDQIQAIVYCYMYRVDEAEIVQVIRGKRTNARQLLAQASICPNTQHDEKINNANENEEVEHSGSANDDCARPSDIIRVDAVQPDLLPSAEKGSSTIGVTEALVRSEAGVENKEQSFHLSSNTGPTVAAVKTGKKQTPGKPSCDFIDITTSRVSLYDPIMMHLHNWKYTILPRIRSFVDAVYSIRRDDHKRYQLLSALDAVDEKTSWDILHSECAWLRECDTAFRRLEF